MNRVVRRIGWAFITLGGAALLIAAIIGLGAGANVSVALTVAIVGLVIGVALLIVATFVPAS